MTKNTKFNILDNLKIKDPCHESWGRMSGDEKKKHCAKCSKYVNNISSMTKSQAVKVLCNNTTEKICIRYNLDDKGKIKFKSNFSFNSILRTATLGIAALFTLIGISNNSFAEDVTTKDTNEEQHERIKMGEMLAAEPSPSSTPDDRFVMGKMKIEPSKSEDK